MATRKSVEQPADLGTLVSDVVRDVGKLLGQQVDLLRSEVGQELRRVGGSAAKVAAGGGLTAAGALLCGHMAAHLLHERTRLPLWACYGISGAALTAGGTALLRAGSREFADVHLLPPQTTAALGENLAWLKEQVTPAAR